MNHLVNLMLERLDSCGHEEVLSWAAPVPCFGNLGAASVATLGINPSNREFVDENGDELTDSARRFHTLNSLKIERWMDAGDAEIEQIIESCSEYFFRNPYGNWFNRLNPIVAATGSSYYDRMFPACHIDLLPFATGAKWGSLAATRRKSILNGNSDLLRELIQASNLDLIILNGQSVVAEFVTATGIELEANEMPTWSLPRASGDHVMGTAYHGMCDELHGESLSRPLKVLGFNHNIQSSFGVTGAVVRNIARWVQEETED